MRHPSCLLHGQHSTRDNPGRSDRRNRIQHHGKGVGSGAPTKHRWLSSWKDSTASASSLVLCCLQSFDKSEGTARGGYGKVGGGRKPTEWFPSGGSRQEQGRRVRLQEGSLLTHVLLLRHGTTRGSRDTPRCFVPARRPVWCHATQY